MNQKQSEDFDSTVRRLAEEAETAFQAHSWARMEKLLDENQNKRRFAWWYWTMGVLLAGAALYAGYFYSAARVNPSMPSDIPLIGLLANSDLDKSSWYALKKTADQIFKYNEPETGQSVAYFSEQVLTHNPVHNPIHKTLKYGAKGSDQQNIRLIAEQHPIKINLPTPVPDLTNSSDESPLKESLPGADPMGQTTDLSLSSTSNFEKELRMVDARSIPSLIPALNYYRPINFKVWPDQEQTTDLRPHHLAIVLGGGWSPEYTSIVKRSVGKAGNIFGFHLGLSWNRWTISAGLQKSSKDYNGAKEDYEILDNSYYKNLVVTNIKGECTVLQLPVSVQYKVLSSKTFSLQLNAAVSSLRMDKEFYAYTYYHANWKPGYTEDNYSNKNWHWLAAASTGITLQKSVSRHVGIYLNPYYQLPIKGIGEGKVRLQSFGSLIGLAWSIPASK